MQENDYRVYSNDKHYTQPQIKTAPADNTGAWYRTLSNLLINE